MTQEELLQRIEHWKKQPFNDNAAEHLSVYYGALQALCYTQPAKTEPADESVKQVKKEADDVLPAYKKYKEIKRQFQLGDATKEKMLSAFDNLARELRELIQIIYRNTNTPEERERLQTLLDNMSVGNI